MKIKVLLPLLLLPLVVSNYAVAFPYKPDVVASVAHNPVPNHTSFNNKVLKPVKIGDQYIGTTVNTHFTNDTSGAGCGAGRALMEEIYNHVKSPHLPAGLPDYSANYIALNVFNNMGFDENAPAWDSQPAGNGLVKGYKTYYCENIKDSKKRDACIKAKKYLFNIYYPYHSRFRTVSSLFPAYNGLWNNGLNCGRWVKFNVNAGQHSCNDVTGPDAGYTSKACKTKPATTFSSEPNYAYVMDSCEDANGWCRDDYAHIDLSEHIKLKPDVKMDNYYLNWQFTKNPYYSMPNASGRLKDIWLAWSYNPTVYWSYLVVANLENGISRLQFNIGKIGKPVWVDSHMSAGGNSLDWSSKTNSGSVWVVRPLGSLTATSAPKDPQYEIRLFDADGYPNQRGQRYIFDLNYSLDKAKKVNLVNEKCLKWKTPDKKECIKWGDKLYEYHLFYQGKPEASPNPDYPKWAKKVVKPPQGSGEITVDINNLPKAYASKILGKLVLISDQGFSYLHEGGKCSGKTCSFGNLPLGTHFKLFANFTERHLDNGQVLSLKINEPGLESGKNYTFDAKKWDFQTTYTAKINVRMQVVNPQNSEAKAINANPQAWFDLKPGQSDLSAITQGCYLNTYLNGLRNQTTCDYYYTASNKGGFSTSQPDVRLYVKLPTYIGGTSKDGYMLKDATATREILLKPDNDFQGLTSVVYEGRPGLKPRTVMLWLDPASSQACLNAMDHVEVTFASDSSKGVVRRSILNTAYQINPELPLSVDKPLETSVSANVVLLPGEKIKCRADLGRSKIIPGVNIVEAIKLVQLP